MRELDLLEHIYGTNMSLPTHVTIGPGDDTAGVRISGSEVLVTVDQVADGVHFDLSGVPLKKIARKAVARSLSDIAAMAGVPTCAVVSAALPRGFGQGRAEQLFDAMRTVAAAYDCPLVGGDVTIWDGALLLSTTVLGEPAGVGPVTRRGARVGDVVCVTGYLGGSSCTVDGYTHHLDFEPRIDLARKLAGDPDLDIHCMIDLSDGLGMDLPRLCGGGRSGVSLAAQVWVDRLPLSRAVQRTSHGDQKPTWYHALADGEDYELCFTVSAQQAHSVLPAQVEGVPITQVGVMTQHEDGTVLSAKLPDGSIEPICGLGWEHHD